MLLFNREAECLDSGKLLGTWSLRGTFDIVTVAFRYGKQGRMTAVTVLVP